MGEQATLDLPEFRCAEPALPRGACSGFWLRTNKFDPKAAALADRHYSRRTIGSPQFMPPGETIVLITADAKAVWGWWRPHPRSGIKAMNGLDGWTCTIFRNEGPTRSSELVMDAERVLIDSGVTIGPDGLITYVWDKKVRSTNPGWCFKLAGWRVTGRSADGRKTLLQKTPNTQCSQLGNKPTNPDDSSR